MSLDDQRKSFFTSLNKKKRNSDAEMSFFDHLEELRWHIIRSLIVVVVIAGVAFSFPHFLFDVVLFGPKRLDFWTYRQLCKISELVHQPELCVKSFHFTMLNTDLAGQFTWNFTAAIMAGLIIGFPYLLWELWRFISPALKKEEKKHSTGMIAFGSILFLSGVLFGYYIVMPLTINFLGGYTISDQIVNQITLDSYFSMLITLALASGITFEMPILAYYLSRVGIITPKLLRNSRRYAVIIILIVAAVITPSPDIMTQLIVSAPLFILFEISIFVSAGVERGKKRAEKRLMKI